MRYKITWQEVSNHEVTVSAERLAELIGVPLAELPATLADGEHGDLPDTLATVEGGYVYTDRDDISITAATP